MEILVCPSDRFGLEPKAKNVKLINIYLITALGEHPNKAKFGVMCTENNIRKVVEIAKKPEVLTFLSSQETQCWFIQNDKWVKHYPDVGGVARDDYLLWKEGKKKQIYLDYNVEEMYSLYEYVEQNAKWMLTMNKAQVVAQLAGVSFDSIRQIKPYIKVDHKKLAARTVKPSHNSFAMLKDIVDEYKDMNLLMGRLDDESNPVVKEYLKHGSHVDEKGYTITSEELLVTVKGKWEKCDYVLRYMGKARQVSKEKDRYAISTQNARVMHNGEVIYFSLTYMNKSTTLFNVLYETDDYVKKQVDAFLAENKGAEANDFSQVFGYAMSDNLDLIASFSKLDIELNVNGKWVKFDMTARPKQTPLQEKHVNNEKYNRVTVLNDSTVSVKAILERNERREKMDFCSDFYGTSSLWAYLIHPLSSSATCIDTEPCYRFWMNWCEETKARFKTK